jgi:hypothetical protein
VCEGVDLEGEVDILLGAFEDSFAARNAGVVDEHGRIANGGADLRCSGRNG